MNKISQMLKLQQELNDATNGLGWENGITKNNKIIDWRRCSYLECAELIESYPWKHWKNIDAEPDYDNIKIEAVDIWHFIMSEALRVYKKDNLGDRESLTSMIENLPNFQQFKQKHQSDNKNHYEHIEVVEKLIYTLFVESRIDRLVEDFINVAIQSSLDLDSLYQLYIGKNILNQFRQENGYKDGSYRKIWNGEEDNAIMQKILSQNLNVTPKELYKKLQESYPND
jgi:dimeric dUTPase (all-alpha-NTP-PPase superfamily)